MDWDAIAFFTFIIVLVAIRSHYRRLDKQDSGGLKPGDQSALDRAMDVARRLEQRVETLERLLDEDAPGWRARART
jgi:phage shock protein B